MSQKIDPKEVLTCLNELGYTNINAQQLKEFIRDLKKLIKYEYKHGKENVKHDSQQSNAPNYNSNYETQFFSEPYYTPSQGNLIEDKNENVFDSLYKKPTVSSKAKEIPQRGKQISVHITKATNRNSRHDHCVHVEKLSDIDKCSQETRSRSVGNIQSTNSGSQFIVVSESTIKSIRPNNSSQSISKSEEHTAESERKSRKVESRSSWIKPSCLKPLRKCDPVALYHHYQAGWKKQKFPGQENHSDLRWEVRKKLLSRPQVKSRTPSSSRSKSVKT